VRASPFLRSRFGRAKGNRLREGSLLFEPVSDPASREIIRRHLDANAIAHQNTNAVLAHLAGNGCQHDMRAIVELDLEKCVGLLIDYRALRWN